MASDIKELHRRALEGFGDRVRQVRDDQWSAATPCTEWDVRALVNHLVSENRWMPPILEGKTIADVGDAFDGDLLGDDPREAWEGSAREAGESVRRLPSVEQTVHLSFGDFPAEEYLSQVFADLLIHGWDLARGIGANDSLDPELVEACARWFAQEEDVYRQSGVIAERPDIPDEADAQTVLLAKFGRKA
jgi:uncharacterized protein (TIGR03086 family)